MCDMLNAVPLAVTIEEDVMISGWIKSWSLTVGGNMSILVFLMSLLLKLTIFILNTLPMKILLVYSSVLWLKI